MVTICSPQLGISPNSSLGGEIYDYQTLKGFSQSGFQVLVYLPKGRIYDKTLKNFTVTYAPLKHIVPPWMYSFLCLPYLFTLHKSKKIDILRIHSPRFLGIAGIIFHYLYPDIPILTSAVTVDSEKIYYPIEKKIYDISSKIIVQSNYMKQLLVKKYHTDPKKIMITFGGMEQPQKWQDKPQNAQLIGKKDKVVLFMGALIPRKNPLFALELYSEICRQIPTLKFVVIGQGPLRQEMEQFVKDKNLGNQVIFINSAYGSEKSYWFSRMDLFIVPSLDEGFGLVTTEAMSYKKVVVASNRAAFKEIITQGKDGFTLPLNNSKIWVKTMIEVLQKPTLRQRIGRNALQTVKEKFNWDRTFMLNKKVVESMVKN